MAEMGHLFGRVAELNASQIMRMAHQFAAEWRHGMTKDSRLYMPGYFLVTLSTWLWSNGRHPCNLLKEGVIVLLLAGLTATLLAPWGTQYLANLFCQQMHLQSNNLLLTSSVRDFIRGIYTLVAWTVLIIGGRRSLVKKDLKPLLIAAPLVLTLGFIRPVKTLNRLSLFWYERIFEADPTAIFSFFAVLGIATFLVSTSSRKVVMLPYTKACFLGRWINQLKMPFLRQTPSEESIDSKTILS